MQHFFHRCTFTPLEIDFIDTAEAAISIGRRRWKRWKRKLGRLLALIVLCLFYPSSGCRLVGTAKGSVASFKAAMAKFSLDDVDDEGRVAKRRKTQREGGETSNPPSQREIKVREASNPPQKETGGGGEIGVTIDPDLLDCSICFYPLCPPVNQCENGHVACPSCWSKLQHKCHICNLRVQCRNIALEKVLEAAHLPCTYANLGCRKSVSYSQRQVHTDTCEFGPSSCPIPGCAQKAFSGEWLGHFLKDHRFPCSHFIYGQSCTIRFNQGDPYFTLFGPDKELFLLVNEPVLNIGNALALYCIDLAHLRQNDFSYELMVDTDSGTNTSSVQLKSQVVSIKEWKRGEVRGSFLLVPLGFSLSGEMKVHVLINKKLDVISLD